ncbi:HigA family addiction module antitoxin [Photobacterium kishitanii]|uniref:Addiction module antidote protein, HigA family n=1 Tax=Photobacterium kishitanii TaxID=318456 RepID=A0A2T3KAY5_9GAMM|nr:HigA family addiction module antitoxin [Photobacterium kishitanii]PSU89787.1 addiction module antidote protein, HigA family [Photobacterium kishitanii]
MSTVTRRKPSGVGAILKDEFMHPLDISVGELANRMGVSDEVVTNIMNEGDAGSDDLIKLAEALGTSSAFWLNSKNNTDAWKAGNSN